MACYHPLSALWCGREHARPGEKIKIVSSGVPFDELRPWIDGLGRVWEPIQLPCGQCIGCRIDYSKTWANRCVCESLSYPEDYNWFVTLTYDDGHVPLTDTGAMTLRMSDLSAWLKRLRRRLSYHQGEDNIRFFGCGEYGSQTFRPHYHVLLFNCHLPVGRVVAHNCRGDEFFSCPLVEETWGQGNVVVGRANWLTSAYTARYVLKKQKGVGANVYDALGIEPEQSRMSRRPGIGLDYLLNHYDDIYANDNIVLPPVDGRKQVVKPPKYFDRWMDKIDPDCMQSIRDKRKAMSDIARVARLHDAHMSEEDYLTMQEELLTDRLTRLPRNL